MIKKPRLKQMPTTQKNPNHSNDCHLFSFELDFVRILAPWNLVLFDHAALGRGREKRSRDADRSGKRKRKLDAIVQTNLPVSERGPCRRQTT